MDIVERVCAAYAWQRALGHAAVADRLCCIVADREHPSLWDANHVSDIRAQTPAEIDEVLQRVERTFGHSRHRLFVVDPLTPPAFVARLALDDYNELTPTIQLVLDGPLLAALRDIELRPVRTGADWQRLYELVRQDHVEGGRSHDHHSLSEDLTRGMVASYRKKAPAYQFFLARDDDVDCAYGAGALCGNGIGMVEDLFTLPAYRRKGIATAIIAHAVRHVRSQGADHVLIGALATDAPKRFYAALGFVPVCLTREYIRHIPE